MVKIQLVAKFIICNMALTSWLTHKYFRIYSPLSILYLTTLVSGFDVYWNVPSEKCKRSFGIDLVPLLRTYNILVNDGDKFQGEFITIFYENQLGLYPKILKDGTAVNGGLPQLGNLDGHLKQAVRDIDTIIPSKLFNGLGVIDWEAWRPTWNFNWLSLKIYQTKMLTLTQEANPTLSNTLISKLAETQWETDAKSWMLGTLELAKTLRPKGMWCYYLFPDCYNYNLTGLTPEDFRCPESTRVGNDKLAWLWEASTAICPSIYLNHQHLDTFTWKQRIWKDYGRLQEAVRVAPPESKLYPYINYCMRNNSMVPKDEFFRLMAQIATVGSDGAVIWGSSVSVSSRERCSQLRNYITETLGPATEKVAWNYDRCAHEVCNGRGICTWSGNMSVNAWTFYIKEDVNFSTDNIVCKCSGGYIGRLCEN